MGRSRRSRPNLAPQDAVFARRTARRFGNATGLSRTLSLMQMIEFTSSFDNRVPRSSLDPGRRVHFGGFIVVKNE